MNYFNKHITILALLLSPISTIATAETEGNRSDNTIILSDTGVKNLKLKTVLVDERDFESTIFAIGRVADIPSNKFSVSSRISGRATSVNFFLGDRVDKGQVLASVESRLPGSPPPTIDFKAPRSGVIIGSSVLQGQPVEPDKALFDLSDRSEMWVVAQIPEGRSSGVRLGTKARISFPARHSESILAELVRFGVKADYKAGSIQAIYRIPNVGLDLLPGMRAEIEVIKSSRPNVLAVPNESLQGDPANRVVYVKDFEIPNGFVRAPIVTGEKNGSWIEITEGLFPGDEVVTRGSYSLGFVGEGSGMSLKEALDAAHGHEHAEDGSELTDTVKKQPSNSEVMTHVGEISGDAPRWLFYYSIGSSILVLLLGQMVWNAKKTPTDKTDAR